MENMLELLRSGHSVDLMEGHVDFLLTWVLQALDLLASRVLPSVANYRYLEDQVPPHTSFKSRQRLLPPGSGQLQGSHVSPWLWLLPPGSGQLQGHHVSP
jgi:hypothetical protein